MGTAEWFADEGLWQAFYPFMFTPERLAAGPLESEAIARCLGVHSGRLLDLGCGPGRHAIPFCEAGFRVTGVDSSAFLLGKAAEEAARRQARVEWVKQDMRTFVREGAFDVAVCMLTSFGYFEDDDDNRRVLQNVGRSLVAGGRFVLDVMGKELLAGIFQPSGAQTIPGAGTHFIQREWLDNFSRLENRWTLVTEEGAVHRHSLRHWVYSARELELMLLDSGFAGAQFFGDLSGQPYGPSASRLIAVARRA
jgi:SAM-dependent methyltransferase